MLTLVEKAVAMLCGVEVVGARCGHFVYDRPLEHIAFILFIFLFLAGEIEPLDNL